MKTKQEIELNMEGQEPVARVPCDAAWDLVEYLANERVHVQYSFEESRVVVRFHHLSLAAVQQLLDRWCTSGHYEDAYRAARAKKAVHA
jgi:hypothetical protein